MTTTVAYRNQRDALTFPPGTMQVLFAVSAVICLMLGIGLTRLLSVHFEQRVFSLIIFCALQLLPLCFALRMPSLLTGRLHLLVVTVYFLVAFLANIMFPQLKSYLTWLFYFFCIVVLALSVVSVVQVLRASLVRLFRRGK
ncbi:hypothetical protein [Undibacterium sp.]|uniref:hypothetical protein n=1 Tax=Undibacterium sp. TaxID=1914977 RepID=UPI00272FF718|nr:hypothetical protein [Undibacterium sp.]MDP1977864.1 hypothetical protein [Undibacterium sp.]